MWSKEASSKGCSGNNEFHGAQKTQKECQTLCESTTTCVGISFHHQYGNCRTCDDDTLSYARYFDFYRRPGNKIYFYVNLILEFYLYFIYICSVLILLMFFQSLGSNKI